MTFCESMLIDKVVAGARREIGIGYAKHGALVSPHDGFARLAFELVELGAEVAASEPQERRDRIRAEALQVAGLALRIATLEWEHAPHPEPAPPRG